MRSKGSISVSSSSEKISVKFISFCGFESSSRFQLSFRRCISDCTQALVIRPLGASVARRIYLISHNIARQEIVNNKLEWVHRKGATRAFPAGHPSLKNTLYAETGHPILLPGNPRDGSVVMVAQPDAKTCYSVNHGAGRVMGRGAVMRQHLTCVQAAAKGLKHFLTSPAAVGVYLADQ